MQVNSLCQKYWYGGVALLDTYTKCDTILGMARKETKVPLNLRVEESVIERLDILAEQMGMERSEVARRVITGGLKEMEETVRTASSPMGKALVQLAGLIEGNAEERAELSEILRSIAEHKKRSKTRKKNETD